MKYDCIYIIKYYSAIKRMKHSFAATRMNLKDVMSMEVNQAHREKMLHGFTMYVMYKT
jgi:hypothetical protein